MNTRKLWHITPASNLKSILENGLIPTIGPRSESAEEPIPAVYLFPDGNSLVDGMTNWLDDEFDERLALIEVEISEDWIIEHDIRWESQVHRTIPPESILILFNDIEDWDGEYPGDPPEEWFDDSGFEARRFL